MVRLEFDVKRAVQAKLDQADKTLREMKPEQRQNNVAFIERLEYDIFYGKEKLSVLGVAGYKQTGSLEEREKSLNDEWARKRRGAVEFSRNDRC